MNDAVGSQREVQACAAAKACSDAADTVWEVNRETREECRWGRFGRN